ncbi:hypothetical protein AB670_03682 [Chryseobacterium sp. MOF25P]|nr:hypothetical protein AB670_03682 [Chryseobacterium sp. MOF25P]OBW47342.1 hypothetical protein AB671_00553 [Chryseobacterium sp. BGARF1]
MKNFSHDKINENLKTKDDIKFKPNFNRIYQQ